MLRALTQLVYSPAGFALCFLHFRTVCSERRRWPLVWEHLSSFTQRELQPWCFHILPFFLLKIQTVGWMLGRGIVVISWKQRPFHWAYCRKLCKFGQFVKQPEQMNNFLIIYHLFGHAETFLHTQLLKTISFKAGQYCKLYRFDINLVSIQFKTCSTSSESCSFLNVWVAYNFCWHHMLQKKMLMMFIFHKASSGALLKSNVTP